MYKLNTGGTQVSTYNVEEARDEELAALVTVLEAPLHLLTGSLVVQPPTIPPLVHPLPALPGLIIKAPLRHGGHVQLVEELGVEEVVLGDLPPAHGAPLGLGGEPLDTEVAEHVRAGQLYWVDGGLQTHRTLQSLL